MGTGRHGKQNMEIFKLQCSEWNMSCLYQGHTTTIRNAAHLSAECHSLKRGAAKQCHLAGLPTFEDALSDTLLTDYGSFICFPF